MIYLTKNPKHIQAAAGESMLTTEQKMTVPASKADERC